LKIGRYVLAIVIFGTAVTQPNLAKEMRSHRADRPAASAAPKSSTGEGAIAKGTNPVDTRSSDDAGDARMTVVSPRPGFSLDKNRDANVSLKISAPGNSQARRVPTAGLSDVVARNAIGQPIGEHDAIAGSGGERVGSAVSPAGALGGTTGLAKPSGGLSGPSFGQQNPHPISTASIVSRGKIDGAGLIRPPLAPAGLGGPAKAVAGINGTTFRPKR
jgi:hypothetical protein